MFLFNRLSNCDVETALLALVDGVAAVCLPEIVNDFCKNIFQTLQRNAITVVKAVELRPTDIERGAIEVARLLRGGSVALSEFGHSVLGAQQAVHPYSVALASARLDGVLESLANLA